MNDSLVRKFCESRHRWLIVATATGLVALAALLPMVDDFFDKRTSRSELSEELAAAKLTAQALPAYEKQNAAMQQQLESLEARTVDEEGVARFRSKLVDVVRRESGCQIRRIEVGAPARRPWKEKDQPLGELASATVGAPTPFVLERRSVTLAVDGNLAAIQDFLGRLEKEQTLSHPRRLHMQAVSAGGDTVTLELELWLFALTRTAA
jgi:hypothetical protein